MDKIVIHTSSRTYPVMIGSGAINKLKSFLSENFPALTKIMIITDENVGSRYLSELKFRLSGFNPVHFTVPNGEHAKTFDVYYDCLSFALEQKLDRKSLILAFGGGAVGDLSGFVAASFMRGIPFIQIPTTILAHDSAVGGKVAINHPLGKNMIGAFYQPEAVFYDLDFLHSLPLHERRSGFAEVIKHSLISDEDFYVWLRENVHDLDQLRNEEMLYFLKKGIRIKEQIVSQDEKESGIRAFLNFGHTLGHAIEGEAGYGNITHGEGVVIGMMFALGLSKKKLGLSFHLDEFESWLKGLGYQTSLPDGLKTEALINRMKHDKKSFGGRIQFVLLSKIGEPKLCEIDDRDLLKELTEFTERRD